MDIGKIIKEHRKKKKLTQQELGRIVFVSKQAVSKWENGHALPDIKMFKMLSWVLDIDENEFLTDSDTNEKNAYNHLRVSLLLEDKSGAGMANKKTFDFNKCGKDKMNSLSYELLEDKKVGDIIEADGSQYYFMCRQELPDGDFCLLEEFAKEEVRLVVLRKGETKSLVKIFKRTKTKNSNKPISIEAAFDAGEDIGARALNSKSFHIPDVDGLLPEMDDKAYFPIGHPLCDVCASVDRFGNIWNQKNFCDFTAPHGERIIYDPRTKSGSPAASACPRQSYLDSLYPIVINEHRTDSEILESMYIMEVGDLRLGPSVWIRNVRISLPNRRIKSIEYCCVGTDSDNVVNKPTILEERFYDCLVGLIWYYDDFLKKGAKINLPDKRLERSYNGTLLTIACLFNGPQARYGHRFYSFINHNNFPPNYITSILSFTLSNHLDYAGLLVDYFLGYVTDPFGRIIYRQGPNNYHGFSASELGQLLWVISKYHRAAGKGSRVFGHEERICALCNYICSKIVPSDIVDGAYVVRTCAEADTNERVADYLQNVAWSIRGLEAAVRMLDEKSSEKTRYEETAILLRHSLEALSCECAVKTDFGDLVPFNLQYRVLPLTMSGCRTTSFPVDEATLEAYLAQRPTRKFATNGVEQELMENRYSNYRYYPELLSSCLLTPEQEAAIIYLRENYGGEFLGMIRFERWLDDWPAYNLAINYMERGLIDKFLLLLSAHAAYHGLPDFHTYYEQVGFKDEHTIVKADTSTPSILLNNIMLNFMFCYENLNSDTVHLLKGIPANWLGVKSFSAKNLRCSFGTVSVSATPNRLTLELDGEFLETRLYLNGKSGNVPLPEGVRAHDDYFIIEKGMKKVILNIKNR